MSDSSKDRFESAVEDAKGRGKVAAGDLMDRQDLKEEGQRDRASGAVKKTSADVKEGVDKVADKVSDKMKDY